MAHKQYERPYTPEEIRAHYPERADWLLNDPAHRWTAETGIELIHEEPSRKEQMRIWKNWNAMTPDMKKRSDEKSFELFHKSNSSHHEELMRTWDKE